MRASRINALRLGLAAAACVAALALPARAQLPPGKIDPDGYTFEKIKAALPELFAPAGDSRARPADIPDVIGPGAVLRVGSVYMKVTNYGHCGNFFQNLSTDPSGQWPGASGIEFLSTIRLGVAGVNPQATDPASLRRVSYLFEWRPPTLDKVDRIYKAYDGIINGARYVNDDKPDPDARGVPRYDEDFLDGRDDDGDGRIDEDFGALGQEEYTCLMRDDTKEAINATFNEKHVPLGLEVRQAAWAYSIPGFSDFDVIEYTVFNRSGHTLDSLCIGWLVDMDCGPAASSTYFRDDFDLPGFPTGEFTQITMSNDKRLQDTTMRGSDPSNPRDIPVDSALCPRFPLRVNGFSLADDNGDEGLTRGVPSFLLINHTIDPLGVSAPSRVGFAAFRSFTFGTPYSAGGRPLVDQQYFEFMEGTEPNGIDETTGFWDPDENPRGDQKDDYGMWCSVGPFRNVLDGASVQATVAFQVKLGSASPELNYQTASNYQSDYDRFKAGTPGFNWAYMKDTYPSLEGALAIQTAYEGLWIFRSDLYGGGAEWPFLPNGHGRETALIAAPGTGSFEAEPDCRDTGNRTVTERTYEWFDYDCDYCTGAYDSNGSPHQGTFHATWNVGAPPPNPNANVAANYNYSDNPDKNRVVAAGDGQITLAWDNLSEVTADPKTAQFDFRGYKVWKAANWTRPVGAAGPGDDDWSLLSELRFFNYFQFQDSTWIEANYDISKGVSDCPKLFIPNYYDTTTKTFVGPRTVPMCLRRGDLWDRQTGIVIRPDTSVACRPNGNTSGCETQTNCILGSIECDSLIHKETRKVYPIGRYKLIDREVKNGFLYFYSVTAFDSTGPGAPELGGRRSAIEAEGIVPQFAASRAKDNVWVVPNPYRGFENIAARSSAWDLTPNATDPTGTHIDFFGLPSGTWTIKIFTVAGDLVAEIRSTDQVNESVRGPVVGSDGQTHPGYNRQQDNSNDGQARWNLISRNGQDVVSGIYMFTVVSDKGNQRGKFVIIR
jgi:hypothetical protein